MQPRDCAASRHTLGRPDSPGCRLLARPAGRDQRGGPALRTGCRSARRGRAAAAAGLDAAVRGTRPDPDGVSGAGGVRAGSAGARQGRPLGQREGVLRRDAGCFVCRAGAAILAAGVLEGAGVGPARLRFSVESRRDLDDGHARAGRPAFAQWLRPGRLVGPLDHRS